jgi:hypothetical protein
MLTFPLKPMPFTADGASLDNETPFDKRRMRQREQ